MSLSGDVAFVLFEMTTDFISSSLERLTLSMTDLLFVK